MDLGSFNSATYVLTLKTVSQVLLFVIIIMASVLFNFSSVTGLIVDAFHMLFLFF